MSRSDSLVSIVLIGYSLIDRVVVGVSDGTSVDVVLLHKSFSIPIGIVRLVQDRARTETVVVEVVGPGGRDEVVEQVVDHTQVKLDILVVVSRIHYILEIVVGTVV